MNNGVLNGKALVAVCDILGFSDLVLKEELTSIIESYSFFRKTAHHSLLQDTFPEGIPTRDETDRHPNVGIEFFSDTIFLYTRVDSDDNCRHLLRTVSWLLYENMFHKPTRLRAGIAYGEVYIDDINGIFLGKAIVEASQLERAQQWSGAALSLSAEGRLNQYVGSPCFVDWPIVRYSVPLKKKDYQSNVAINWTNGTHLRKEWEEVAGIYWTDCSEKSRMEDVIEKIQNTREFHDHFCQMCFPENRTKFSSFKKVFNR
jgi:hypothetical protein